LLAAGGIVAWHFFFNAPARETSKIIEAQKEMVALVNAEEFTPYTKVTGSYPQFKKASESFNRKIGEVVERAIHEHKKSSEENWKARYGTAKEGEDLPNFPTKENLFPLDIKSTIVRNDNRIISFVMYINEFAGGAHGQESIVTFNYDVKKRREIEFNDVMKGDRHFLKKLSTQAREILRTKLANGAEVPVESINEDMLEEGTEPKEENFTLFTLPANSLITFYFSQYQVAPYVFGSTEITLTLPLK
jgi:hypothetical protein